MISIQKQVKDRYDPAPVFVCITLNLRFHIPQKQRRQGFCVIDISVVNHMQNLIIGDFLKVNELINVWAQW